MAFLALGELIFEGAELAELGEEAALLGESAGELGELSSSVEVSEGVGADGMGSGSSYTHGRPSGGLFDRFRAEDYYLSGGEDLGDAIGAEEFPDSFFADEKSYSASEETSLLPRGLPGQHGYIGRVQNALNAGADYADALQSRISSISTRTIDEVGMNLLGEERYVTVRGIVDPIVRIGNAGITAYQAGSYVYDAANKAFGLDSSKVIAPSQGTHVENGFVVPLHKDNYRNVFGKDGHLHDSFSFGYQGVRDNLNLDGYSRNADGKIMSRIPVGVGGHYGGYDLHHAPTPGGFGSNTTDNAGNAPAVHSSHLHHGKRRVNERSFQNRAVADHPHGGMGDIATGVLPEFIGVKAIGGLFAAAADKDSGMGMQQRALVIGTLGGLADSELKSGGLPPTLKSLEAVGKNATASLKAQRDLGHINKRVKR